MILDAVARRFDQNVLDRLRRARRSARSTARRGSALPRVAHPAQRRRWRRG